MNKKRFEIFEIVRVFGWVDRGKSEHIEISSRPMNANVGPEIQSLSHVVSATNIWCGRMSCRADFVLTMVAMVERTHSGQPQLLNIFSRAVFEVCFVACTRMKFIGRVRLGIASSVASKNDF